MRGRAVLAGLVLATLAACLAKANGLLYIPLDGVAQAGEQSGTAATPTALPPQEDPDRIDCDQVACLALTFDDGPGPYTARIVADLQRSNVRATFFLIGQNVTLHPDVVKATAAAGMELGDHTQNHVDLRAATPAKATAQIESCAEAVERAAGRRPTVLRPPFGSFTPGVTPSDGLPVIMWNADTRDWATHDAADTTRQAVADARPGGIVLMHDIVESTADALPDIIDQLRRKGFRLVTVSKLLGHPEPGEVYHER